MQSGLLVQQARTAAREIILFEVTHNEMCYVSARYKRHGLYGRDVFAGTILLSSRAVREFGWPNNRPFELAATDHRFFSLMVRDLVSKGDRRDVPQDKTYGRATLAHSDEREINLPSNVMLFHGPNDVRNIDNHGTIVFELSRYTERGHYCIMFRYRRVHSCRIGHVTLNHANGRRG